MDLEEANEYLQAVQHVGPYIAYGVSLCILSPVILLLLLALAESGMCNISESIAAAVGTVMLLVIVAIAVFLFIVKGSRLSKYEFLDKEEIETGYGVDGMVKEKKEAFREQYVITNAVGVFLCIFSSVPLILTAALELGDEVVLGMVCLLLAIIAVAVNLFVRVGYTYGSYERLLREGDFTDVAKRKEKRLRPLAEIYWTFLTAVYLGISFFTGQWSISWVIWPVGAVVYALVVAIAKAVMKIEE